MDILQPREQKEVLSLLEWKFCERGCVRTGGGTEASEMTESERAVIPQQKGPLPRLYRGEKVGVGTGAGWITEVPRASVSFLFIYSPCLFFFSSSIAPWYPLLSSPIFSTLSLCPLSTPPHHHHHHSLLLLSSPLPPPPKGKEILPAAR